MQVARCVALVGKARPEQGNRDQVVFVIEDDGELTWPMSLSSASPLSNTFPPYFPMPGYIELVDMAFPRSSR